MFFFFFFISDSSQDLPRDPASVDFVVLNRTSFHEICLIIEHGCPDFIYLFLWCSETFHGMSSKMQELNFLVMKMIYESFGIEKLYGSFVEETSSIFRIMKYRAPPGAADSSIGLVAHTDKNAITILCQNEVQGLEIQTKNGDWAQAMVPENAFTAVVGDALKVRKKTSITQSKNLSCII